MKQSTVLLCVFALTFCVQTSHAGAPYVGVSLGYGGETLGASVVGVNHPTRCDSFLYSNPQTAPSDSACTDDTPRRIFEGSLDAGNTFMAAASAGLAWDRLRIEAELLARSHGGESVPAIASADNAALQGKDSEWSAHSPPHYRLSDFTAQQLFVNLHYTLAMPSAWRPYVGVGVGFARIAANYSGSYLRRTVEEGYVAAAGGDPANPEEWQLGAAGTLSSLHVDVDDVVFGYQVLAGLDRSLSERTDLFIAARWSAYDDVSSTDIWTTIRSHAPVQADGTTPFETDQTFDDLGGFAATVGLRYAF